MRHGVAARRIAAAVLALAGPAAAQTIEGPPLQPPDVNAAVIAAVAARLGDKTADLVFKELKKSRARNGQGYCGQAAAAAGAPFAPFHVILEANGTPSVLLLSEAGKPGGLMMSRENATTLLGNFGCLE